MALKNTAEGQPNGTTLTAGNSGGGSGDAFLAGSTGTLTRTYSNEQAMNGAQSYKLVPTTSSSLILYYAPTASTSGALQGGIYLTGYPTANQLVFAITISSGTPCAGISINANGAIVFTQRGGGLLNQSANGAVPLNTWVRFDICAFTGATTSNGRAMAQASLGNSPNPFWYYDSGTTANTSTTTFDHYRFGKLDDVPDIATFYIDDLAADNAASNFIPPTTTNATVWLLNS